MADDRSGRARDERHSERRAERVARRFEVPMLVAAVLALPTLIIQVSDLGEGWQRLAGVLDWVIWLSFTFELVVMLAVVPDRRRWLLQNPVEVLIVAFTGPFLPDTFQLARLLRLARLFLIVKRARRVFSVEGVRYAALITLLVVVGGGTALVAVEPRRDLTPWDGVWWAVETITTVGYGDIYPVTTAGRLIGMVVMVSGIGFVALLTGALAHRFLQDGGDEANPRDSDLSGSLDEMSRNLEALRREVSALRESVERAREKRGREERRKKEDEP